MRILVIIPARGGSKGVPGKNIKLLNGKPLIGYSIDIARQIVNDEDICVSTDDTRIIETVGKYELQIPFVRPEHLASDHATTSDVLIHALKHYQQSGKNYDIILLLQPTSPLRTIEQVREAISLYRDDMDMVVSVKNSHAASTICIEDEDGNLQSIFNKTSAPRQSIENVYEYNGAIYVINPQSLLQKGIAGFTKRRKYIMPEVDSLDIDTPLDWLIVETIMKNRE